MYFDAILSIFQMSFTYFITALMPYGPFCQIRVLMYYIKIGLTVLMHSLFG